MTDMQSGDVLFTGGGGLLGTEFKAIEPTLLYPSHVEFDVTDYHRMERYILEHPIRVCIHAAAFTSPPAIDKDPMKALLVNSIGTSLVTRLCMERGIKLIYISTDYVFRGTKGNYAEEDEVYPVNRYAWSKLGGECAVRLYDNSLIVRTSFGPNVFLYERAFEDQWTSRESVALIAKKIYSLIDSDLRGVMHVGGERKTVYEYAKSLGANEVIPIKRNEVQFNVPQDTSLNCSLFDTLNTQKE